MTPTAPVWQTFVHDRAQQRAMLRAAYTAAAAYSDDPRTQLGSVLYGAHGRPIAIGANQMPPGIKTLPARVDGDTKYAWMLHAEQCAILDAASRGAPTDDSLLVCYWAPCTECAKVMLGAGVKGLLRHKQAHDLGNPKFSASIDLGDVMLLEAGVEIVTYDGPIDGDTDGVSVMFNGRRWCP